MTDQWTPVANDLIHTLEWLDEISWGPLNNETILDGERATEDYLDLSPISVQELGAICAACNVWLALMGSLIRVVDDGQLLRLKRPRTLFPNLAAKAAG